MKMLLLQTFGVESFHQFNYSFFSFVDIITFVLVKKIGTIFDVDLVGFPEVEEIFRFIAVATKK